MKEIWYELYDSSNGQPICYLTDRSYLTKLKNELLRFAEIKELEQKPEQLEFIVKKEEKLLGSFEHQNYAIKYIAEKLNTWGEIHPNPQTPQLKIDI